MSFSFVPLLPWWILVLTLAVMAGAQFWAKLLSPLRLAAVLLVLAAMTGPTLVQETRVAVNDVALVVVDDSASAQLGQRSQRTASALAQMQERLSALPNLEVRTVHLGGSQSWSEGTRLFQVLGAALADIPKSRLAGVIVLTDGVIHDSLKDPIGAPLHVLLTGDHGEIDRRVRITGNPDFALVGQNAHLTFRVDAEQPLVPVKIEVDGAVLMDHDMPVGQDVTVQIPVIHTGPIVVDIGVAAAPHELSLANNHAVVSLSGIRDRLKVLLLSGVPHVGERMWRNLLKADAGVDLIHFTILRSPDKFDPTPLNELALINFPVRELFEQRLTEFDLVILDRYGGGELPQAYLQRLAQYVQGGGALLLQTGAELAPGQGLAQSPLAAILPALPKALQITGPVRPVISPLGLRHPVTAALTAQQGEWGPWLGYVPATLSNGTAALVTPNNDPLVVLARVGQGRVGEILSATGWLWARGWQNGGPYTQLLRRTAHWLMKEPELEEESLSARHQDGRLLIARQSLSGGAPQVVVTGPEGQTQTVALIDHGDGSQTAQVSASGAGVWRVSDGAKTALALEGEALPLEWSEIVGTDRVVKPVVNANHGHLSWLVDGGVPDLRRTTVHGAQTGSDWLGLIQHNDSQITGRSASAVWPGLLLIGLAAGFWVMAWRRESRSAHRR